MTLRTAGTCPSSHLLKRIPQRYFPETPDQHYITPPRALSSLQDRESDFEFRFYDPVFTPTSDGQLSDSSSPYSPDEHTSSFGSQLFVFPGAYLSPKMAGSSRDKGRSQPEDYSLDLPFIQSSPIPPGTVWPTSQAGSASAFAFPQPDFTHQGHGLSSSLGMKGWDQGLWDPGSSVKVAETVGLSPNQQYSSFYPTSGEDAAGGRYTPSPETRRRRRTTPEGTKFKCQVCGQLCSRSFNLRMHMQTHDPDRKKPFECPDEGCEAKFSRRADLDRHLKTERDFECEWCQKCFSRKDTLKRHKSSCPKRFTLPFTSANNESYSTLAATSSTADPLSQVGYSTTLPDGSSSWAQGGGGGGSPYQLFGGYPGNSSGSR